ncbi:hypothetical protein Agub_g15043 [Astrephomene gubernaculifera]|uniref:phytol kinase n=1 Tax=Astrephomene gubernaculifera TaxID=47775 RepID=A0AAD3HSR6_9CHLO|nr:hypothetical protein Agub_g15043 [Astrephomene gubernaculifera]
MRRHGRAPVSPPLPHFATEASTLLDRILDHIAQPHNQLSRLPYSLTKAFTNVVDRMDMFMGLEIATLFSHGFWSKVVQLHGTALRELVQLHKEENDRAERVEMLLRGCMSIFMKTNALKTGTELSIRLVRAFTRSDMFQCYAQLIAVWAGAPNTELNARLRTLAQFSLVFSSCVQVTVSEKALKAYGDPTCLCLYTEFVRALSDSHLLEHMCQVLLRFQAAAAATMTGTQAHITQQGVVETCGCIVSALHGIAGKQGVLEEKWGSRPLPAQAALYSEWLGVLPLVRRVLSGPCLQFLLGRELIASRLRLTGSGPGHGLPDTFLPETSALSASVIARGAAAAADRVLSRLGAAALVWDVTFADDTPPLPGATVAGASAETAAGANLQATPAVAAEIAAAAAVAANSQATPAASAAASGSSSSSSSAAGSRGVAACGMPYRPVNVFDLMHGSLLCVVHDAPAEHLPGGSHLTLVAPTMLLLRLFDKLGRRHALARLPDLWYLVSSLLLRPQVQLGRRPNRPLSRIADLLRKTMTWQSMEQLQHLQQQQEHPQQQQQQQVTAAAAATAAEPAGDSAAGVKVEEGAAGQPVAAVRVADADVEAGGGAGGPAEGQSEAAGEAAVAAQGQQARGGVGRAAVGPMGTTGTGTVMPAPVAAPEQEPDCPFGLRCALESGLLPAVESLTRRLASAKPVLAEREQLCCFLISNMLCRTGVWPAVLAHGSVPQVTSLVVTLRKVLLLGSTKSPSDVDTRGAAAGQPTLEGGEAAEEVLETRMGSLLLVLLEQMAAALLSQTEAANKAAVSQSDVTQGAASLGGDGSTPQCSAGQDDRARQTTATRAGDVSQPSGAQADTSQPVAAIVQIDAPQPAPTHAEASQPPAGTTRAADSPLHAAAQSAPVQPASDTPVLEWHLGHFFTPLALTNAVQQRQGAAAATDLAWLAKAGGLPTHGPLAAEQQRYLATFAIKEWLPILATSVIERGVRGYLPQALGTLAGCMHLVAVQSLGSRLRLEAAAWGRLEMACLTSDGSGDGSSSTAAAARGGNAADRSCNCSSTSSSAEPGSGSSASSGAAAAAAAGEAALKAAAAAAAKAVSVGRELSSFKDWWVFLRTGMEVAAWINSVLQHEDEREAGGPLPHGRQHGRPSLLPAAFDVLEVLVAAWAGLGGLNIVRQGQEERPNRQVAEEVVVDLTEEGPEQQQQRQQSPLESSPQHRRPHVKSRRRHKHAADGGDSAAASTSSGAAAAAAVTSPPTSATTPVPAAAAASPSTAATTASTSSTSPPSSSMVASPHNVASGKPAALPPNALSCRVTWPGRTLLLNAALESRLHQQGRQKLLAALHWWADTEQATQGSGEALMEAYLEKGLNGEAWRPEPIQSLLVTVLQKHKQWGLWLPSPSHVAEEVQAAGSKRCSFSFCMNLEGMTETELPSRKVCARCRSVSYCSGGCQLEDWNVAHQWGCKSMQQMRMRQEEGMKQK